MELGQLHRRVHRGEELLGAGLQGARGPGIAVAHRQIGQLVERDRLALHRAPSKVASAGHRRVVALGLPPLAARRVGVPRELQRRRPEQRIGVDRRQAGKFLQLAHLRA